MTDKYRNYADLAAHEREGQDYGIVCRLVNSPYAIVAPHGGSIEPGTSEIANAVSAAEYSFYAFEGLKAENNGDLHITSTRFDEPICMELLARAQTIITIHGRDGNQPIVFVGGLDGDLKEKVSATLLRARFQVSSHDDPEYQGLSHLNICNRGTAGKGVQLEISRGLRRTLFQSLSAEGRQTLTPQFTAFVAALRDTLAG